MEETKKTNQPEKPEKTNQPEGPENEIKKEETANYLDQYLRLQAEFINYRKRMDDQWSRQREAGAESVLIKILPVLDDFELYFEHHKNDKDQTAMTGVKMIYEKLMTSLDALGLSRIKTDGLFDPEIHEAMLVERKEGAANGEILEVWQPGYMYKEKLLRPARVKVAEAVEVSEKNEQ